MHRQWSQDELAEHWTLLPDELKLLANKTGATNKLLPYVVLARPIVAGSLDDGVTDLTAE